ncbi:MAG: GntR family transcriptional regulator [Oscillospiraceae bacterium]|nr:GntR family transcriptional regulator [Oscillospiraceae bacterium]
MQMYEEWGQSFDDRMPIYRQIILRFRRAFVRGDIKPGDRIPSIRELSGFLRVNTNTIQRVYREMERDGVINSKRGTGYYFTEDTEMTEKMQKDLTSESMQRFVDEMSALGFSKNEILEELKSYLKGVVGND